MRSRVVLHAGEVTELLHGKQVSGLSRDAFVYDMRVNARGQLVLTLDGADVPAKPRLLPAVSNPYTPPRTVTQDCALGICGHEQHG